jgi:hypothetical protein
MHDRHSYTALSFGVISITLIHHLRKRCDL